ncbi:MAG: hypothetical protein Q8911_00340 [Bacillota bacterium]|nr:hypothetical protein [Bacillota bacterium]
MIDYKDYQFDTHELMEQLKKETEKVFDPNNQSEEYQNFFKKVNGLINEIQNKLN